MRGEDGEIVFDDLGDPLLDKWERELAQGLDPDLEEGLSNTEKEKLKKERERSKGVKKVAEEALINDDFTKTADAKKYDSKFIVPGSREDEIMTKAAVLGRISRRKDNPEMLGGGLNRRGK